MAKSCCIAAATIVLTWCLCNIVPISQCATVPAAGELAEQMPSPDSIDISKLNAAYWYDRAARHVERVATQQAKINPLSTAAKNVIFFIGDGHGISSITASRWYKVNVVNETKTNFYQGKLEVDNFEVTGLVKTYVLDSIIADSAGTATAYLAGVKTRYGHIGLDSTGDGSCNGQIGQIDSIANWAKAAGKSVGLVTTTTITHASPSPLYAHMPAPYRGNEYANDKDTATVPNCVDIAKQFVLSGQNISVALGGGRSYFLPKETNGKRSDGVDLLQMWLNDRGASGSAALLQNKTDLEAVLAQSPVPNYVLGLFNESSLPFICDVRPDTTPSLPDMTAAAITLLSKQSNGRGFFLFVEGGRIDHAHHNGQARYALTEAIEFDQAISTALSLTNSAETLIVVSADHSHTLTLGGYLKSDANVLDLSLNFGADDATFTALQYASGPGARNVFNESTGSRRNDSADEAMSISYHQQALVPMKDETHGGEDVPLYATGINSRLFSGVVEQSYIPFLMACAAGIPVSNKSPLFDKIACPWPWQVSRATSTLHLPAISNNGAFLAIATVFAMLITTSHCNAKY